MDRFFVVAGWLMCLPLGNCSGQTGDLPNRPNTTSSAGNVVGGGCDGCELMYIGMPVTIASVDTSAGWFEKGQKLLVAGTVFQPDGRTPAPNVIIYYWQTNAQGYYAPVAGMDDRAKRHGHIRGWAKTDRNGKYAIYTIRPAPYPNDVLPAHIHLAIKEPGIEPEYYVDEVNFDDDKLLLPYQKKHPFDNRGGSGVVRVLQHGDVQVAEHDMVLGLNIPHYPEKTRPQKESGLRIGMNQPSFTPYHAYGPDKGTRTCPVCKYGRYHGIVYFVGNHPDWTDIKRWLTFLEQESAKRQQYLKAYFVYGNAVGYRKEQRQQELDAIGRDLKIRYVALTFIPSFADKTTEADLNQLNPDAANTFIIYRHRRIVDKYVNLKSTAANFDKLTTVLTKTKGDFFDLPSVEHP